ncbi:bifunctional DNA-formamidopyrimidine glycosylase/DNA-(apurinic or apyrimidinic site) lyase [Sphingomonas naphthae]|uniref:Formamidopyrimidine-DNA glycosylase n=1 Tax=Sphingomonas naphthae TaxID=1813468 RepID=A0ABY7TGV6_9SPHN|nr:bifunctional DNA-formamidopyrimidine glycosylase/DNA-(apurinic or apyrimidinic site) lyase [Sphingomonas naphthae]WCT72379.1 bifunctional DNA-formamidopyrimidine glycosylase/DNA-(apurinic or apyrimidinic site) lyase [Sphingomonas naphthae]
MPELPEVETTVRGLARVLWGRTLVKVEPRRADLRRAIPADLRQRLTGAQVTGLGRRAKYGLIETDRDDTLIFHLGMSGRWRIAPETIGAHDHLLIETDTGMTLSLNDPRRFGSLDLMPTDQVAEWPPFRALGPEPLGDAFNPRHLRDRLKGRIAPIKLMLLDQRIVAGLGNIYVCEALNMARIDPRTAAGTLTLPRLTRLVAACKDVLVAAIEAGGSTLRDYARPDGELGYFSKQFRVYGREGEACPCGGIVERQVDGGRSTFWCRKCQK